MVANLKERLAQARIVPVIRHNDRRLARQACIILAEEGAQVLEITATIPGFADLINELRTELPSVEVGAGTIMTAEESKRAISAGAGFLVSPCWSEPVFAKAASAGVPYLPGAMTTGEVHHHHEAGAEIVKVFPASVVGGADFIKALHSVFPGIALMPTGGIGAGDTQTYIDAGALCVGVGGKLLPADQLERGDIEAARIQIRAALKDAGIKSLNEKE